jgi:hypothetical protein
MRMRNVTLCLPEDTHRRARVMAAENGVSLSFLIASIIDTLPGIHQLEERIAHRRKTCPTRADAASRVSPARPETELKIAL